MKKNIYYIICSICIFLSAVTEAAERSEQSRPQATQTGCFDCVSGICILDALKALFERTTAGAATEAATGAATGAISGAISGSLVSFIILAGTTHGYGIMGAIVGGLTGAKIAATNAIIANIMGSQTNPALSGGVSGSIAAAGFVADNITGCYLVRFPVEVLVASGIISGTGALAGSSNRSINIAAIASAVGSLGGPVVEFTFDSEVGPAVGTVARALFPTGVITVAEALAGDQSQERAAVRAASGIVDGNSTVHNIEAFPPIEGLEIIIIDNN